MPPGFSNAPPRGTGFPSCPPPRSCGLRSLPDEGFTAGTWAGVVVCGNAGATVPPRGAGWAPVAAWGTYAGFGCGATRTGGAVDVAGGTTGAVARCCDDVRAGPVAGDDG